MPSNMVANLLKKKDFVTVTNKFICNTDNRALFLDYNRICWNNDHFFRHYIFYSNCNQIKIVVYKLLFWQSHFFFCVRALLNPRVK